MKTTAFTRLKYACMAVFLGVWLFARCGRTRIEDDTCRIAALQCRAQKMMGPGTGQGSETGVMEERQRLVDEAVALYQEMERKYKSAADKSRLAHALMKEMEHCK